MEFVYLTNKETGGATRLPDEPGVVDWYTGHGWKVTDEPVDDVFVPATQDDSASAEEWVELFHAGIGARHMFPNNPDALSGASDAGWLPERKPAKPVASKPRSTKLEGDDK